MSGATDVRWWAELRSSALIGTGRRAVPTIAELDRFGRRAAGDDGLATLDDLSPPVVALLDAAAMGAIALRAGGRARPAPAAVVEPAPAEDRLVASPTATQILELLLGPAPLAGDHRRELIAHWCRTGAAAGHRVPDALLVALLDHATATAADRTAVDGVLGGRGRWLADQNPSWSWATAGQLDLAPGAEVDPQEWAHLTSSRRVEVLAEIRRRDPAVGRALLLETWSSDSASARAAHLALLVDGLGPADEAVLESALDDRSKVVRAQAVVLLEQLSGSARSRRMVERLSPLVTVGGRLHGRRIEVAPPDEPDPAATRDGLGTTPAGRSKSGHRLETMVAGTPLTFWTDLSGADPARTLARIDDDDVRAGIVRAARNQADPGWAAALFEATPDPRLLPMVDPTLRPALLGAVLRSAKRPKTLGLVALLEQLPGPWSRPLSDLVLWAVQSDAHAVTAVGQSAETLARNLDPGCRGALEAWLSSLEDQASLATALRRIIQYQSLHRSITEAFS